MIEHRLVVGRKLVLGGVTTPFEKGLDGHSDAVCDAMLGAAALGDIGRHFPDTDAAYKDMLSIRLLKLIRTRFSSTILYSRSSCVPRN